MRYVIIIAGITNEDNIMASAGQLKLIADRYSSKPIEQDPLDDTSEYVSSLSGLKNLFSLGENIVNWTYVWRVANKNITKVGKLFSAALGLLAISALPVAAAKLKKALDLHGRGEKNFERVVKASVGVVNGALDVATALFFFNIIALGGSGLLFIIAAKCASLAFSLMELKARGERLRLSSQLAEEAKNQSDQRIKTITDEKMKLTQRKAIQTALVIFSTLLFLAMATGLLSYSWLILTLSTSVSIIGEFYLAFYKKSLTYKKL